MDGSVVIDEGRPAAAAAEAARVDAGQGVAPEARPSLGRDDAIPPVASTRAADVRPEPHPFLAPGGRLPILVTESLARRRVGALLATLVAMGWFFFTHAYWAPAHGGVDQNGYLVGGRMIADHLSTGQTPLDLFSFVGKMWVGMPWGVFYPKYPIGLPILYAVALEIGRTRGGRLLAFCLDSYAWMFGAVGAFLVARSLFKAAGERFGFAKRRAAMATPLALLVTSIAVVLLVRAFDGPLWKLHAPSPSAGVYLAESISPISMTLALVGTFALARLMVGSFAALLTMIAVGMSPTTLGLVNNPNSHAATLFCVTWGMYLLVRWWQDGGAGRAAVAGLLLGYAATIRYTEGMLVLPVLVAALFNVRWRNGRSVVEAAILCAWWAIPVLCLVLFNLGAMGTITGYDTTNESQGFTFRYFTDNWELTVRQMYNTGLFFLLPFAVAGMALVFAWSKRVGLLLLSWVVPSLILYTAYYWAPDGAGLGYMRFYLTIFPPLALLGYWTLLRVNPGRRAGGRRAHRRGREAASGGAVAAACCFAILGLGLALFMHAGVKWAHDHVLFEPAQPDANQQQPVWRRLRFGGGGGGGGAAAAAARPGANPTGPNRATTPPPFFEPGELAEGLRYSGERLAIVVAAGAVVIAAGAWVARGRIPQRSGLSRRWLPGPAVALAAAGITVVGAGMGLYAALPQLETDERAELNLATTADLWVNQIRVPQGSVVFANVEQVLHHLQLVGDYRCYDLRQFTTEFVRQQAPERFNPNMPSPLQKERADMLYRMLRRYTEPQLREECQRITDEALAEGRRVFVVLPRPSVPPTRADYFPPGRFNMAVRGAWSEAGMLAGSIQVRPRWMGFTPPGGFRPQQMAPPPQAWEVVEILPGAVKPVHKPVTLWSEEAVARANAAALGKGTKGGKPPAVAKSQAATTRRASAMVPVKPSTLPSHARLAPTSQPAPARLLAPAPTTRPTTAPSLRN